jgi:hypothetical protein
MSARKAQQVATQYLRDQAKIISKYGDAPRLSGDRYKEALADTKKTFKVLSSNRVK